MNGREMGEFQQPKSAKLRKMFHNGNRKIWGGAGRGGVVVKRYQDSLGDAGEGICIYSYLIKPSDSFVFSLEASLCVDHLLMTTANSSAAQTDHFNPPIIRRKDTLIH